MIDLTRLQPRFSLTQYALASCTRDPARASLPVYDETQGLTPGTTWANVAGCRCFEFLVRQANSRLLDDMAYQIICHANVGGGCQFEQACSRVIWQWKRSDHVTQLIGLDAGATGQEFHLLVRLGDAGT